MAGQPPSGGQAPGVYLQGVFPTPEPSLLTGVPAFLGYASQGAVNAPQPLTLWPQFGTEYGAPPVIEAQSGGPSVTGFLACAVRGFFENGGLLCYVVRLDDNADSPLTGLRAGLAALDEIDSVDLVCAPDIMVWASSADTPDVAAATAMQAELLADCQRVCGRFAILDAVLTSDPGIVEQQRSALTAQDGALYHPWLWAPDAAGAAALHAAMRACGGGVCPQRPAVRCPHGPCQRDPRRGTRPARHPGRRRRRQALRQRGELRAGHARPGHTSVGCAHAER